MFVLLGHIQAPMSCMDYLAGPPRPPNHTPCRSLNFRSWDEKIQILFLVYIDLLPASNRFESGQFHRRRSLTCTCHIYSPQHSHSIDIKVEYHPRRRLA
jgi:hypothetical protein